MLSKGVWNYKLYREMISHTLSVARETRMEVFFFDEACQRGNTFGERLSYAFSQLFSKGFASVISIGNDCPMLSSNDLINAASILDQGKDVVGPTSKGGTYLIGMQSSSFQSNSFSKLDWNTSEIYSQLCSYLKNVSVLFVKDDINTAADLYDFVSRSVHYLAKAFQKLVFGKAIVIFFESFIFYRIQHFYNKPLRAPPVG